MSEGKQLRQEMLDGGMPAPEVETWAQGLRAEMAAAGFKQDELAHYWGDPVEPNMTKASNVVRSNLGRLSPDELQTAATNPTDALLAGFQYSSTGLAWRGRKPDVVLPEDAGLLNKIAYGAGMLAGDLPAGVAGFAAGAVAAAPTGPMGSLVGGGAGGAALPAAIREVLMDQYSHPDGVKTWGEFWSRTSNIAWNTTAEAITGAASTFVGGKVGAAAIQVGAGKVAGGIAGVSTMAVSATAIGGALHGRVPDADDFLAGSILALGLHSAGTIYGATRRFIPNERAQEVANNLRTIYSDTGLLPHEAVQKAASDISLRTEILAPRAANGTRVSQGFEALTEPEPFKAYKPEISAKDLDAPPKAPPAQIEGEPYKAPPMTPVEAVERPQLDAVADVAIRPEVVKTYGLESTRLADPSYKENAQRIILADLAKRYMNDDADVLVAYRDGVERADTWIAGGRKFEDLPVETQHFLQRSEAMGVIDRGFNAVQEERMARLMGDDGAWASGLSMKAAEPRWMLEGKHPNEMVVRRTESGQTIPDPYAVASYLQKFGKLAGFKFQVGPATTKDSHTLDRTIEAGPHHAASQIIRTHADGREEVIETVSAVYIPENTDAVYRRWYGLGKSEVIFHEVGHALDLHFHNDRTSTVPVAIKPELIWASQQFRPRMWERDPDYNMRPAELMADAFAVWLSNSSVRQRMPEFTKIYGRRLQPFLEAVEQALPRRVGGKWEAPPGDKARAGGGGGKPPANPPPPKGPNDPDFQEPPKGPKKIETDMAPRHPDELVADINAIIAPEVKQGVIPEWMDPYKLARTFESQLAPARRLDEKIGVVKPGEKTMLGIEDMFRMTYGAKGRAMQMVRYGPVDAATLSRTGGDVSYIKAFDTVRERGGNAPEFMAYRLAKRTVEKAEQGIDTGIDLQTARELLAAPGMKDKYELGQRLIQEVHDGVVKYVQDSGIFSAERAVAMKALNREYIVFRRLIEPDYMPPQPGRNFRVRDPARRMEGSDKQIIDPMSASLDNIYLMVAMADRNRAILNIKGAIDDYWAKQPKRLEDGSRTNPYYKIEDVDGSVKFGEGDMLDAFGKPIPKAAHPALEPFLAVRAEWGQNAKINTDAFIFFKDGKLRRFVAVDPDLAQLLRNVQSGGNDPVSQMFIKFAGLERAGIVTAPDYLLRSWHVGQLAGAAFAEGMSTMPYRHMLTAIVSVWTKNEKYQEFVSKGGFTAALADLDTNYLKYDLQKILSDTSTFDRVWNVARHPVEAARMTHAALDNVARIAAMTGAEAKGYGPLKAAMLSRKAHLDYGEGFATAWVNTWSRMVPFMMTGFKDIQQVSRAVTERPLATLASMSAVFVMPTLMNYALNAWADQSITDPKDKYANIDRWVKDTFWVLPAINGVRIKIPRGVGTGGWFGGALVERFMDWWIKDDPAAFNKWAQSFVKQVVPPLMPSLAEPIVDHASNTTDLFSRPLVNSRLEKGSGYMEYTHDTSETAKALSRKFGPIGFDLVDASPIIIENYARKWLGTIPMEMAKVLEKSWKEPTRPHEGLADTPFLRSFFLRRPLGGAAVNEFYDGLKSLTEKHNDLKLAVERGDLSLVNNKTLMLASVNVVNLSKAMANHRTALEAIYNDKTLTNDEKLKFSDSIATGMVEVAKQGSAAIKAVKAVKLTP